MRKDISIIAATVYGNRGAEAMLCTVIGALRKQAHDTHFHVFSYYPEDDRARISVEHVSVHSATPLAVALKLFPLALLFSLPRLLFGRGVLRWAPASIRALGDSMALVDLAGVSFIPGREKFLPYNVLTLLPAMLLGTPVVKMPQALGPLKGGLNRMLARCTLPLCRRIWARGEQTLRNLEQSGLPGLVFELGDDLAFNYEPAFSLSNESPQAFYDGMTALSEKRGSCHGVIGLCPSSVVAVSARRTGVAYESVMAQLVAELAADGFLIVLFPNATRDISGDKERNNDLPLLRRIQTASAALDARCESSVLAFDMDMNTAAIKALIGELDVAMVSRFHAMVGALSLCVPVNVLGWSHKYLEVMARFGLESLVLDYTKSEADVLREKVNQTFESRDEVRARISSALPGVKACALRPVTQLLELRSSGE